MKTGRCPGEMRCSSRFRFGLGRNVEIAAEMLNVDRSSFCFPPGSFLSAQVVTAVQLPSRNAYNRGWNRQGDSVGCCMLDRRDVTRFAALPCCIRSERWVLYSEPSKLQYINHDRSHEKYSSDYYHHLGRGVDRRGCRIEVDPRTPGVLEIRSGDREGWVGWREASSK